MNYRNPIYNILGAVDCEIEHLVYGWIPFTARPDDAEQYGRLLFAEIINEGNVAAYVPITNYTPSTNNIRQMRDRLLSNSDWTQLPDAQAALNNAKKLAWAGYRQELRDIPQQSNFPANVVWPNEPT